MLNWPRNGDENANERVGSIFAKWNAGRLSSYLLEICCAILKKKDDKGYLLDQIVDRAEQKGTGKMCLYAGIEAGSETTAMVESVFARFLSNKKEERVEFSKAIKASGMGNSANGVSDRLSDECMEKALYLCKAISYVQGLNLMAIKRKEHGWSYNVKKICDVWRDGCILRCEFLDVLKNLPQDECLEQSDIFINIYNECYDSLKKLCTFAIENDLYVPVFSSCLCWLNGLKMSEKNGSLIQAMRDYFGRHGIELQNGEHVNIDWN